MNEPSSLSLILKLNLAQVSKEEADRDIAKYKEIANKHDEDVYEAIRVALRYVRQGAVGVVNLPNLIRTAGVDHLHRPHLAVSDANKRQCYFSRSRQGALTFSDRRHFPSTAKVGIYWIADALDSVPWDEKEFEQRGSTNVPMIPPSHVPKFRLGNYTLIWETAWDNEPPKQAALLRHVAGQMYAVYSMWEFTKLEQIASISI